MVAFEGGLDVLRFLAGGRVVGGIFLFLSSFFFFLFACARRLGERGSVLSVL